MLRIRDLLRKRKALHDAPRLFVRTGVLQDRLVVSEQPGLCSRNGEKKLNGELAKLLARPLSGIGKAALVEIEKNRAPPRPLFGKPLGDPRRPDFSTAMNQEDSLRGKAGGSQDSFHNHLVAQAFDEKHHGLGIEILLQV